jgi:hypothetical protein
MKKILILTIIILNFIDVKAQDFEGTLIYNSKTNIHIQKEINYKVKSSNRKDKDSIHVIINDSIFYNRWKKKGRIVDSIKIVFGDVKFRKTYYKKEKIEYIFDLVSAKKITHTPKYECIETTNIELVDYTNKVQIVESDSIFTINDLDCKKIKIIKSNFYFIDIYYKESEFKNLADGFIYDINNNLLFQNLYFLKNKLEFKKIIKLNYYSKPNAVDFEYILKSMIKKPYSESDFALPKYDYCFWDVLEDKKLMKKHKKRMKLEKKRLKNEKSQ